METPTVTTIRFNRIRIPASRAFAGVAVLLLLPCSAALALNNLDAPPTSSMYWHQDVPGLAIPTAIGAAEPSDRFGAAVAKGDFNGDGFEDLAIGSPGEDATIKQLSITDAGIITILPGSATGLTTDGNITLLLTQPDGGPGMALAAGDIDGDGYDDLVVGLPQADDGTLEDAGIIAVCFGGPAGITGFDLGIAQDSPEIGNNSESNDRFGASLSIGDANGDGFADVAIGAPGESYGNSGQDSGAVYLLYGGDDGLQGPNAPHPYQVIVESDANLAYESTAGNQYGYAVLLHDLDGDGADELSVGTPFSDVQDLDAGLVYIHPSDGAQIVTTGTTYLAPSTFEEDDYASHFFFGSSLSGGDTVAPLAGRLLLVGAPGYDEGVEFDIFIGRAYLYRPGNIDDEYVFVHQRSPETAEPGDEFGRAVLLADLNDDGLANERIVSVPGEDNESGAIQLRDPVPKPSYIPLREGDSGIGGVAEAGERFGQVLARGNFNGRDGEELVIGVPDEAVAGAGAAGKVLVLSWDPQVDDVIFADDFELIVR
jgi:hypothetical protein